VFANDFKEATPLAQFRLVTPEVANFSRPESCMQQHDNKYTIPKASCFRNGCHQRLFFLIVQMVRGDVLLSDEFDRDGGSICDDVALCSPPKVAFQTDEGTIDRRWLLPLKRLQVASVPRQRWGRDRMRYKGGLIVGIGFPISLKPCDEVA